LANQNEVFELAPGFECEYDDSDNSFTVRWPNRHWLVAFSSGKIVCSWAGNVEVPKTEWPTTAQGTEAQRAETVEQGSVHDGPVP
jgi:hypothetical protein